MKSNRKGESKQDSGANTPPVEVETLLKDEAPAPERWSHIEADQRPDFIYGGPFIRSPTPAPLIDTATPRNVQLRAIWKRSFAYHTVRERLPIIITRVIDYLSREKDSIKAEYGATDEDLIGAIQYCTRLKSEIVTNKRIEPLQPVSEETERWNSWIAAEEQPFYFTAVWVFTECYVYRRLREAFAHNERLQRFDPFRAQKMEAFAQNVSAMIIVANHVDTMLQGDDTNTKEALVLLLKLALWANRCDLSLSAGAGVDGVRDPVGAVGAWSEKLLVDDALKVADFIADKGAALAKRIEEVSQEEEPTEGLAENADGEVPPAPPCPTKMTVAQNVMIDIVCDNSGYELFMDLCIGHFLLTKNMVQKVRYHVKAIPWFVSDVTPVDFHHVIAACANAEAPPSQLDEGESEAPSSALLQELGDRWQEHVDEGRFQVEVDDFWTSPHVFKDMKKYDPELYRKLQFPICVIFKGDLNYRKLVGERNWPPTTTFEQSLEGFNPAPLVAVRTVKAELIAGLPKGKYEQLQELDEKWMEKGEYGLIQFCPKKEDLKVSDMPCAGFGISCNGGVC